MRQTLTVEQREGTTFVRWRRVTIADIVALFALPMAAAWGVASALGWEELGEIHTREDPIAESDAAGRSSTKTTLSIVGAIDQRIEIDDLSEDNAERLKRLLAESTAQPGT